MQVVYGSGMVRQDAQFMLTNFSVQTQPQNNSFSEQRGWGWRVAPGQCSAQPARHMGQSSHHIRNSVLFDNFKLPLKD